MAFFYCTVNEIGPAADGTETPDPVIYINLTDTGGSFVNQWFQAAERSKKRRSRRFTKRLESIGT